MRDAYGDEQRARDPLSRQSGARVASVNRERQPFAARKRGITKGEGGPPLATLAVGLPEASDAQPLPCGTADDLDPCRHLAVLATAGEASDETALGALTPMGFREVRRKCRSRSVTYTRYVRHPTAVSSAATKMKLMTISPNTMSCLPAASIRADASEPQLESTQRCLKAPSMLTVAA